MKKFILFTLTICFAVLSAFAQSSFELRYGEATSLFLRGEYTTAIEMLQRALSENVTPEQKTKANQLINQCRQEIEAAKKLIVGRKNFENLSYLGGSDSTYVNVTSRKAWYVVSSPDWVDVRTQGDMIYFSIHENPTHEDRNGSIEITLDRTSTTYINFSQIARPVTQKTLNIHAEPQTVQVLVDKSTMNTSPMSVVLSSGYHRIEASRNLYAAIDTTIYIEDDLNTEAIDFPLHLKRLFATISIDITLENGSEDILSSSILTIDGKTVDLHPNIHGDYNDLKAIAFYTLYSNGTIPIQAGTHIIKVVAPGYNDYEYVLKNAENNVDYTYHVILKPKTGFLKITDLSEAKDAEILIDGKLQTNVTVPCDSLIVNTGSHVVTFRKKGMISTATEYPITIEENKTTIIDLSMIGCDIYTFGGSIPTYSTIYIDSVEVGRAPMTTTITKGIHHIEIRKIGHLTVSEYITASGSNDTILFDREMPETMRFSVKADEDFLHVMITQKGRVIASGIRTPCEINIPMSSQRYRITLQRDKKNRKQTAYKDYFRFNNPKRNSLYIQSWSNHILQLIEGQYYVYSQPLNLYGKEYTHLGDGNILKIQLLRGLSTSLLKGKIFLAKDESSMKLREDLELTGKFYQVLPAFSCFLINEEFRLGGAIIPYFDIDMLLAYTWYPKMTLFLPLSHVSGHNVFGGIELSTRFPVATLTVKVGYEALIKGEANIYSPNIPSTQNYDTKDCFVSSPLGPGQFVMGVGLSLGVFKSKGNNILRLW